MRREARTWGVVMDIEKVIDTMRSEVVCVWYWRS